MGMARAGLKDNLGVGNLVDSIEYDALLEVSTERLVQFYQQWIVHSLPSSSFFVEISSKILYDLPTNRIDTVKRTDNLQLFQYQRARKLYEIWVQDKMPLD